MQLFGQQSALALPGSVANVYRCDDESACRDAQEAVAPLVGIVGSENRQRLIDGISEYLLLHGRDDYPKIFDLGAFVGITESGQLLALRQALLDLRCSLVFDEQLLHAGVSSTVDANGEDEKGATAGLAGPTTSANHRVLMPLHTSGSISRAVATGFAIKLLVGLRRDVPLAASLELLSIGSTLAEPFYVGDEMYPQLSDAFKVEEGQEIIDSKLFDIAEGSCLYNKAQYWALMSTGEAALTTATSPGTFEDRWLTQLALVRRLILHRDFGAFLMDSNFLTLAGRFALTVPDPPPLKPEDKQQQIFDEVLRRIDRNTVTRLLALLKRAQSAGRCEATIRQAKAAGVIRTIGEAIGSIRTPIKMVDMCLQVLAFIAQNTKCSRPNVQHYAELFPNGYPGDLVEHHLVVGSGRGDEGVRSTIAELISKNFLHRRDAWVVISYIHPSFVHINRRLVQEAVRRALPPLGEQQASSDASQSPTHYKALDDLLMVSSAMVVLSHAITNPNARRHQVAQLCPSLPHLMQRVRESLKCAHCKIAGWDAQQSRLGVAAMRIVVAVVKQSIEEAKPKKVVASRVANATDRPCIVSAAPSTAEAAVAETIEVVAASEEVEAVAPTTTDDTTSKVTEGNNDSDDDQGDDDNDTTAAGATSCRLYPNFYLDLVAVLEKAALSSNVMLGALEVLRACCKDTATVQEHIVPRIDVILDTLRSRFIDEAFHTQSIAGAEGGATAAQVAIQECVVSEGAAVLAELCIVARAETAGSLLVSLALHSSQDWSLAVLSAAKCAVVQHSESSPELTSRLAAAMASVLSATLPNADVTAQSQMLTCLNELAAAVPAILPSLDFALPHVISWLQKDLLPLLLLEYQDSDEDDCNEGTEADRLQRRVMSRRNTLLCALLDTAKLLTADSETSWPDEVVANLLSLVDQYRAEVPYLNPLLQCLVNLAANGTKKSAFECPPFHGLKGLCKAVSDCSKSSAKLTMRLASILGGAPLEESLKKHQAASKCAPAAAVVPKGFTLITSRKAKPSSASPNPPTTKVMIRSAASKTKDAERRDEGIIGKAARLQDEGAAPAKVDRKETAANQGSKSTAQRHSGQKEQPVNNSKEHKGKKSKDDKEPKDSADADDGGSPRVLQMKGDASGINLDVLSAKMAKSSQAVKRAEAAPRPKPSSWASMAKCAKTREEREAEQFAAFNAEQERNARIAMEKAEQRRKEMAILERKRAVEERDEDHSRRFAAPPRGQSEVASPFPISSSSDSQPQGVDVHALLNRILSKPATVVRRTDVSQHQVTIHHQGPQGLRTIDDEDDDQPLPVTPFNIATSLSQLRIGGLQPRATTEDLPPQVPVAPPSTDSPQASSYFGAARRSPQPQLSNGGGNVFSAQQRGGGGPLPSTLWQPQQANVPMATTTSPSPAADPSMWNNNNNNNNGSSKPNAAMFSSAQGWGEGGTTAANNGGTSPAFATSGVPFTNPPLQSLFGPHSASPHSQQSQTSQQQQQQHTNSMQPLPPQIQHQHLAMPHSMHHHHHHHHQQQHVQQGQHVQHVDPSALPQRLLHQSFPQQQLSLTQSQQQQMRPPAFGQQPQQQFQQHGPTAPPQHHSSQQQQQQSHQYYSNVTFPQQQQQQQQQQQPQSAPHPQYSGNYGAPQQFLQQRGWPQSNSDSTSQPVQQHSQMAAAMPPQYPAGNNSLAVPTVGQVPRVTVGMHAVPHNPAAFQQQQYLQQSHHQLPHNSFSDQRPQQQRQQNPTNSSVQNPYATPSSGSGGYF